MRLFFLCYSNSNINITIRKCSSKPWNTRRNIMYVFSRSKNNWLSLQYFGGFFLTTRICLPKWITFNIIFWEHPVVVIIVSGLIAHKQLDYYVLLLCASCCIESKVKNSEKYEKKCYGIFQDNSSKIDKKKRTKLKNSSSIWNQEVMYLNHFHYNCANQVE